MKDLLKNLSNQDQLLLSSIIILLFIYNYKSFTMYICLTILFIIIFYYIKRHMNSSTTIENYNNCISADNICIGNNRRPLTNPTDYNNFRQDDTKL